jgi:hypothetical protein
MSTENTFFAMSEHGNIYDNNHGGYLLENGIVDEKFPAISAGWYAWKHSQSQREMFEAVSKGCLANAATPFYTVDQPFYIYELVTRMISNKKSDFRVGIFDITTVAFNPFIEDLSLKYAYFVNFAGEPGVEDPHFNKILSFMCMDFSASGWVHNLLFQIRMVYVTLLLGVVDGGSARDTTTKGVVDGEYYIF